MLITNVNNEFLKIDSDLIKSVLSNSANYQKIQIDITKNCCDTSVINTIIYQAQTRDTPEGDTVSIDKSFEVHIPIYTNLKITGVTMFSYLTGTIITIPLNRVIAGLGNFPTVVSDINDYINAEIPGVGYPATLIGTLTGIARVIAFENKYRFILDNLYKDYELLTLTYSSLEIPDGEVEFSCANENHRLSTTSLILTPEAFGSETLKSGVYSIKITTIDTDGSRVSDSSCKFVDTGNIKYILATSKNDDKILLSTLYYSLVESGECNCDCNAMCEIFSTLNDNLNITDNFVINKDCGCI